MAYTQKHKYGFRDSLQKGDPEKVIYGVYFDDEFEALESELEKVFDALTRMETPRYCMRRCWRRPAMGQRW